METSHYRYNSHIRRPLAIPQLHVAVVVPLETLVQLVLKWQLQSTLLI